MATFSRSSNDDDDGPYNIRNIRKRVRIYRGAISSSPSAVSIANSDERGGGRYNSVRSPSYDEPSVRYEPPLPLGRLLCFNNVGYDEEEEGNSRRSVEEEIQSGERGVNSTAAARPVSVTLMDPDVLDCPICIEPLKWPVYQCGNGHIACESCCNKMSKKCASCCLPIGFNRCRALEKVLESLRISCGHAQYGCEDLISYTDKRTHEKSCTYAPFCCPRPGCTYASLPQSVYSHFAAKHRTSVKFDFDRSFRVSFVHDQNYVFLQELDSLRIFVLGRFSENAGDYVSVTFIAPASSRREYFYNLTARCGARSIMVTSVAECTARWSAEAKAERFVVVPTDFLTSAGELELELTIWKLEALSLA